MIIMPALIVDDFLDNPNALREAALSKPYFNCNTHPGGGEWPGERTLNIKEEESFLTLKESIQANSPLGRMALDCEIERANFQSCTEGDNGTTWVHQDNQAPYLFDYAFVLYLSPEPAPSSGTELWNPYLNEKYQEIDNVYNRIAYYDTREFHQAGKYFGDSLDSSRLTLIGFIKAKELAHVGGLLDAEH